MSQYKQFPFLKTLEENWEVVLGELNNLLYNEAENEKSYFIPWHETDIYDGSWDVYGLYSFGKKLTSNCKLCPETTKLIEAIPGMTTAGFSALAPNTHIKPHVGYTDSVLRCHLGLIVPTPLVEYDRRSSPELSAGACGMRVEHQIYNWEPGKAFIFDDTLEHEVWHFGDRTRFILLVDFKREGGAPP